MNEIWKRLIYQGKDYGDYYEVSNLGRIRNSKTYKIRKENINHEGYYFITGSLGCREKKITFKIHKAVAESFIPNPNNHPVVNHIDGNKLNNNIDNLEWCTYKYNTLHAISLNLSHPIPNSAWPAKRIKCIELNKCFNSISDCASYLYLENLVKNKSIENTRKSISRVLNGSRKTVSGYRFERIDW